MSHPQNRSSQAGFSLTEVLATLAIGAITAATVASFQMFQLETLKTQTQQVDLQSKARAVVELMGREIRRAGLNGSGAFCGLQSAAGDGIRVQADFNRDGALSAANEDITYQYSRSSGQIQRIDNNANHAGLPLVSAEDEAVLRLQFFDADGNQIAAGGGNLSATQRSSVRTIRIALLLGVELVDGEPVLGAAAARAAIEVDLRNRFFAGMVDPQPCA